MESPEDRAGSSPRGTCNDVSARPTRMPGSQPGIRGKVGGAQLESPSVNLRARDASAGGRGARIARIWPYWARSMPM